MLLLHCYPSSTKVPLHLSVHFLQHSRATTGVPLPLHDTPSLTHLCSTIFFKLILCAPLILRYLCGCNARLAPWTHSISHSRRILILPICASASWIPLHRLPRRLHRSRDRRRRLLHYPGTPEVRPNCKGKGYTKAGTNLMQHEDRTNTHRFCCRRPNASTRVLHQRPQGWRQAEWSS